jgi:DNA-binding response OmpR family regulator/predicted regulator of Ras-like GTPase activity (Roadblock/LC7/MglB family)
MGMKRPYLFQVVVTMSDVWRICVVEGDVSLNQNLVSSLRKDGYVVQGVMNSAEAMRVLWSEEYDVVICALKLPGADGFELLRWLRAYRSNVRPIVLGDAGKSDQRLQALEGGAISYVEKPVDLRLLKDELRRLFQQTGFTASLDSFDLLDVIQIVNMSRKSITLLINTGLEERGTLRFQNGELAWAEYGVLRGEEAFFALAAHKNGTVTQQLSGEQLTTNVTQPLSRLIFQALQYRTKYASQDVGTGLVPVRANTPRSTSSPAQTVPEEIDDSPFLFVPEEMQPTDPRAIQPMPEEPIAPAAQFEASMPAQQKEWWDYTGQTSEGRLSGEAYDERSALTSAMDLSALRGTVNTSPSSTSQGETRDDSPKLPSWLTDLSSSPQTPTRNTVNLNPPPKMSASPLAQSLPGIPDEIRPIPSAQVPFKRTDELSGGQQSTSYRPSDMQGRRPSSPQWSQEPQRPLSSPQHRLADQSGVVERTPGRPSSPDALRENSPLQSSPSSQAPRQLTRTNYAALVSALQTLGYSLPGFIAAAVIDIDSSLLAQAVIDDADISQVWQLLSLVQRSVLNALQSDEWGVYEETIITTVFRHVLMRAIGSDKKAFLVLITTREANFTESLEIMANVEGAISAALR